MLIGFCGRPGAGQDEAADYLEKAYSFAVIRLDEPLRAALASNLPAGALLPGNLHTATADGPLTPFQMLADLRSRPAFADDTLARAARKQIEETGPHPTVVPDVVNAKEAELIRSLGGVIVRLSNQHAPHRGDEQPITAHLISHTIEVPARAFSFYDLLDRLVEEEAWEEATA